VCTHIMESHSVYMKLQIMKFFLILRFQILNLYTGFILYVFNGICKYSYQYEGTLVSMPIESTFIQIGILIYAFQYV
jgi:hypothetical protein